MPLFWEEMCLSGISLIDINLTDDVIEHTVIKLLPIIRLLDVMGMNGTCKTRAIAHWKGLIIKLAQGWLRTSVFLLMISLACDVGKGSGIMVNWLLPVQEESLGSAIPSASVEIGCNGMFHLLGQSNHCIGGLQMVLLNLLMNLLSIVLLLMAKGDDLIFAVLKCCPGCINNGAAIG